ncbi:MAG: D-aminoacylase [Calditrichia bacterium]|nr:D-aminoacylase [Calditrichia bacterium]
MMKKSMTRRTFAKTTALAMAGIFVGCSVKNRYDVIIKNGMILDGFGTPGMTKDLGIVGDKISVLDNLGEATADLIIDATDLVVAPGFIDIHTHTDVELLVDPRGVSKVMQGVTTEVSGNCGYSPFPVNESDLKEMNERLNEKYGITANWNDINGFLSALEKSKISINYATFTGHGSLRGYVVGKNDVVPTAEQMDKMKAVLEESIKAGSFGLSTGLEYAPGSYADTEELIELSKVVAANGGIYNTHMRNEDDTVIEAIEEALRICKEAEVSVEIAHLKACNKSNWHKVEKMLELISQANDQGLPVKADRYPYIAYGTGLSTFLPLWSRQGDTDDVLARLNDKNQIKKIEEYAISRGTRIGGWDRVMISSCRTDENKIWEGKSIQECAIESGTSEFEFIRQLLINERLGAGIVGFAMDEDNLKKVLSSPFVMIGSDGNAVAPDGKLATGKPHPRFYGTFARVLGKYCREEKCFDLPTAVKKMTTMPAEKLGIKKRGSIVRDNFADITIFNPNTVIDKATFTDPHQTAQGIEYVLVNGKVIVEKGKHSGIRSGSVLRHQA